MSFARPSQRSVIMATAGSIHKDRVRLFTEIFDGLSSYGKNEVYKQVIVDELVSTGKFWESDAFNWISYAVRHGEIVEHRPGWYSKKESVWSSH